MNWISTHTPHAGRNYRLRNPCFFHYPFQLTRPMRGATQHQKFHQLRYLRISTHTPHAGRNGADNPPPPPRASNFNSHAPCGAQPFPGRNTRRPGNFNSHAPCGAQPRPLGWRCAPIHFNSHAPCGAQRIVSIYLLSIHHFNSHAPCGAQREYTSAFAFLNDFNSHAPCGAQLDNFLSTGEDIIIFQLTRPMRGAT